MNSRFLIMLVIALILAGVAALIAKHWVEYQTGTQPITAEQNNVQVYVAATDIPFASHIKGTQIKLIPWPKDSVPSEAFTEEDTQKDPKAIVDKVAQRNFYANEILLKPQIKETGGITLPIPEGMRAISVRVDDIVGVAGFILPGNKADIIVTGTDSKIVCLPKAPGYKAIPITTGSQNQTYTLLPNIKILAIDQLAQEQDKPAVVRALTLEVDPKQALCLVQAMRSGALQFTLRNPMDTDTAIAIPEAAPVNLPSLIKSKKPYKSPLSLMILPWGSQKFLECEGGAC
jgi:pilus assembly protein CpaB